MRNTVKSLFAAPLLVGLLAPAAHAATPAASTGTSTTAGARGWTAVDLGVEGSATAVNDLGEVVGTGTLPGKEGQRGFRWVNGALTDLGADVEPRDVNDRGQVVGIRYVDFQPHGFLWAQGRMTDLGPDFLPTAVNDLGDVVGDSSWSSPTPVAKLRDARGRIQVLAGLSSAADVNDKRQVVGGTSLWQRGKAREVTSLTRLKAAYPTYLTNEGAGFGLGAVNESGAVVGDYNPAPMSVCDPTRLAFAAVKGGVRDVGAGQSDASAVAIDDHNRVAVNRVQCQYSVQEVHVSDGGRLELVTDRGVASDMNNVGAVVGTSHSRDSSERRAMLWKRG